MAIPLISLAEPFFIKVLQLINQPFGGLDQLPKLQRLLSADLQAIEQKVHSGGSTVSSGEWLSLKRVLIYWADEVLTNHMPDWQDYVLEQEYYGERNRAWKFYTEAEECVPTGSSEMAEMFYLALVLGFVGDLEGAFRQVLGKEMPGKKTDPAEARRVWAMDLQRRILHKSTHELQGEPLETNVQPLQSEDLTKFSLAAFLISGLFLTTILGMWMFGDRNVQSMEESNASDTDIQ